MTNEYLNNLSFEQIILYFQSYKREKERYAMLVEDLRETQTRTKNKNNKEEIFQENQKNYEEAYTNFKHYQKELSSSFYILSRHLADYYINKYSGVEIEDAIQEAVLACFEKIDLFDPNKGKAFSYMTTCIINLFRQMYRSNKNYNELKKKYHIHLQDNYESIFFRNGKERNNSNESTFLN